MHDNWPRNQVLAVAALIGAMTEESRIAFSRVRREDLFPDHTGISDYIRGHFGLWDGNTMLIRSCGCKEPEDASVAIIEMAWQVLRASRGDASGE